MSKMDEKFLGMMFEPLNCEFWKFQSRMFDNYSHNFPRQIGKSLNLKLCKKNI